jgi:hypothetical protein
VTFSGVLEARTPGLQLRLGLCKAVQNLRLQPYAVGCFAQKRFEIVLQSENWNWRRA